MGNLTLENRIEAALEELRPYLRADGGDISLLEITADMTARVELHGACVNCSMSAMTMRAGVEEAIKNAAPEIEKVEAVNL
ncbi:MAG: NifU family protein [Flavobacteriales bacterium]|jgi:Fe-S cluster biogenesis protein NfuA|nr:NifU family protein [Bacteroidota bacterium]MDG1157923.1 NifU family protein [Flavobacteriales bacterium]MDG1767168.1 NifU family protein [Flavobacteriales bacterium]MDP4588296.1 NifU family protein [Flavobacteriales bacterium]MDP4954169.1 NifU family protein [Flavobacteriales bacterium]